MDLSAGLRTALISAGMSAVITFVLQTYLGKRLEHAFARKLEGYKAELAVRMHAEHGIATRRLEAYPKIVELCYRTRNMARDLVTDPSRSSAFLQELLIRAKELEEYVFRFRIDLEADHVFVIVHRHKNLVLHFSRTASEPTVDADTDARSDDLSSTYTLIEESYTQVVDCLSGERVYHQQI
jgi:hypothetical protein